jgi:multidrug efflux pump
LDGPAIGIVVDDAIVVVENVERNIAEGRSPREATYQAMREVTNPIIAIALVLVAVFVPLAFISGLSGQFYRQFAMTIAISTVISAINSADAFARHWRLCFSSLTRAKRTAFFRVFNRYFGAATRGYSRA